MDNTIQLYSQETWVGVWVVIAISSINYWISTQPFTANGKKKMQS